MTDWFPSSWHDRSASQIPTYDDQKQLQQAMAELAALPPLVTSWEIESLKRELAEAAVGDRFVLQGGDCAEQFEDCRSDSITNKLKILLQMSLILVHSTRQRVTRIGRFAGQYAKPRSSDTEEHDGVTLPSYRGDLINDIAFTQEARRPDPVRMVRGHERSACTLNFIRSLLDGGFADLHHPEYWDLDWVEHSPRANDYHAQVKAIADAICFTESLTGTRLNDLGRAEFFTSHEGLHLPYEEAQTRQVPRRDGWYLLSTHFPWIGMRTALDLDAAHIEFFRGIRNPIGVKVGGGEERISRQWLERLLDRLDPDQEPGRMTLIHRFGAKRVQEQLPELIDHLADIGRSPAMICDPMHGNTSRTDDGTKTRDMIDVLKEVEDSIDIHSSAGRRLSGIHIELTGENVTECLGGARGLTADDLKTDYRSRVDPRLNYEQSLELAILVAGKLGRSEAPAAT